MAGEEVVGGIVGFLRLDADQFHREIERALAEVKLLNGKNVRIDVNAHGVGSVERDLAKVAATAKVAERNVGGMGKSFQGLRDPRVIVGAVAAGMALLGPVTGAATAAMGGFVGVVGTGVLAFQGFKKEIAEGTNLGKYLQGQLDGITGEFAALGSTAASAMSGDVLRGLSEIRRFLPTINGDVEALAGHLGRAFSTSATGVTSALRTMMPLLLDGGRYAEVLANKFADFAASDEFRQFVDYARRELPNVGSALMDLVVGIKDLAVALAPVGDDLVAVIALLGDTASAVAPVVKVLSFANKLTLMGLVGQIRDWRDGSKDATAAVTEHTSHIVSLTSATSPLASALGLTNDELKAASDAQREVAQKASDATLKMQLEGDAAGLLKQQLDILNGKALDVASAQTASASATLGLTKSLKDNGTTLSTNTEKGVANRQAIERKIAADQRLAEAVAKSTGSTKAGTESLKGSKKQLEDTLRSQGRLTEKVQAYIDKLYKVPKKVPPTVLEVKTASAMAEIRAFQAAIDKLHGKSVGVHTRYTYSGQQGPGGGRSTKGGSTFDADGSVKFFAGGGFENHVAQIAPAGAMRVWAEPETGGEAYIPLAQSKRARSEKILAETNRLMGDPLGAGTVELGAATVAAIASAVSRVQVRPRISAGQFDSAMAVGL